MTHTPTPWAVKGHRIVSTVAWLVKPGEVDDDGIPLSVVSLHGAMGGEDTAADAALIVKAVNCHSDLMAALEHAVDMIATCQAEGCPEGPIAIPSDISAALAKGG